MNRLPCLCHECASGNSRALYQLIYEDYPPTVCVRCEHTFRKTTNRPEAPRPPIPPTDWVAATRRRIAAVYRGICEERGLPVCAAMQGWMEGQR